MTKALTLEPGNAGARLNLTESLLTTADFEELDLRSREIRDDPKADPSARVTFGAYGVISRLARQQPAISEMTRLVDLAGEEAVASERGSWGAAGVRHFVDTEAVFAPSRGWIEDLVSTIESWEGASLASKFRDLQQRFPKIGLPSKK